LSSRWRNDFIESSIYFQLFLLEISKDYSIL
jgi:hypothetical protein